MDLPEGNEARQALRDLIKAGGRQRFMPHDAEVERRILAMVDAGLVTPNPDGTITLTGTREQLLAYGLDLSHLEEVPVSPSVDEKMDAAFVSCWNPNKPGEILTFPSEVWEQVRASGENFTPLSAADVRQIQRDNPDGTVKVGMVLSYAKDEPIQVASHDDLVKQLAHVDVKISELKAQQENNTQDLECLEPLIAEYGTLLGTRPGQQFVGVNIIGLRRRDRVISKTFGTPMPGGLGVRNWIEQRPDPTMPVPTVPVVPHSLESVERSMYGPTWRPEAQP